VEGVAQIVEHLPRRHEILTSNPSIAKKSEASYQNYNYTYIVVFIFLILSNTFMFSYVSIHWRERERKRERENPSLPAHHTHYSNDRMVYIP
jgi:hypothetical protein